MSVEREITDTESETDWQERASQIRAVENEDGTLPAIVRGWTIRDDETAVVSYQVRGVDEREKMELDATIVPGETSDFEQFLSNIGDGYTLEDADHISEDTPTVPVVQEGGEWEINQELLEEDEEDDESLGPSGTLKSVVIGFFLGAVPVLGWLLTLIGFADMVNGNLSQPKDQVMLTAAVATLVGQAVLFLTMNGIIP